MGQFLGSIGGLPRAFFRFSRGERWFFLVFGGGVFCCVFAANAEKIQEKRKRKYQNTLPGGRGEGGRESSSMLFVGQKNVDFFSLVFLQVF
jgi:hypothetical protein